MTLQNNPPSWSAGTQILRFDGSSLLTTEILGVNVLIILGLVLIITNAALIA